MAKNNNIDKNYLGLKLLKKLLELMQKRQMILIKLHDEGSLERAASNAKENVISLILDYVNSLLDGLDWVEKQIKDLKSKLERGYYCNNKKKERK